MGNGFFLLTVRISRRTRNQSDFFNEKKKKKKDRGGLWRVVEKKKTQLQQYTVVDFMSTAVVVSCASFIKK